MAFANNLILEKYSPYNNKPEYCNFKVEVEANPWRPGRLHERIVVFRTITSHQSGECFEQLLQIN